MIAYMLHNAVASSLRNILALLPVAVGILCNKEELA